MDMTVLSQLFDSKVVPVSQSEFTAEYRGYNVKVKRLDDSNLFDIKFCVDFKRNIDNDFVQFVDSINDRYGNLPMSPVKGGLGVVIDLNKMDKLNIRAVLDDVVNFLKQVNENSDSAGAIYSNVPNTSNYPFNSENSVNVQSSDAAPYYINGVQAEVGDFSKKHENYFLGILGALIGTLLGIGIRVLLTKIGFHYSVDSIVIASGAFFGYFLVSGKISKFGSIVSTFMLIVGIAVGSYLSFAVQIMDVFDCSFLESLQSAPNILSDAKIKSSFIMDMVVGYFFSVIAGFGAYSYVKNKITYKNKR